MPASLQQATRSGRGDNIPAEPDTSPRVHLVDDDRSFRVALARLLKSKGYSVAEYASAEEALEKNFDGRGVILLDVRMPGLSGLQLQGRLAGLNNPLPIIFVTGHGDIPMSVDAIKAGAEDFLTKPVQSDRLFRAIESALEKYDRHTEKQCAAAELRARHARLTKREKEVFERVVLGKLNKQIAFELGTSERTIKFHRHEVMQKMGAASVADLVNAARILSEAQTIL